MVIDLFASPEEVGRLREQSRDLLSWDLTPEQACDVEMLLNGAFSPLTGFMSQAECDEVIQRKQFRGDFWPVPIFLDITASFADSLQGQSQVALRDQEGLLVAILNIEEQFESGVVSAWRDNINEICLGGQLTGIEAPVHHDFKRRRLAPLELRAQFDKMGWTRVLGFATRRPLHQREINETYNGARRIESNLLLNPAVGAVSPEDSVHYAEVHCFEHALDHYPHQTTDLALTPLYSRGEGIEGAMLHAIVLRNQGCTHYMLDRHYCSTSVTGMDYEQCQEELSAYDDKLGIALVYGERMVHSQKRGGYVLKSDLDKGEDFDELPTDAFAERLRAGLEIPSWFSFPEIVSQLKNVYRPRAEQGITVFFTGFSGSGKSTIANALLVKMMEMGGRPITLLDGDIVRQHLSSELGFSKEHRNLNIRRIGYVASEITKHGGIAICAPIAPYTETRRAVRSMIEAVGGFVEVHVATSIEVCEERDRKGLYAKARAGIIKEFTGISDPYEEPENPELRIDTDGISPEEAAQRVILTLEKLGYIKLL